MSNPYESPNTDFQTDARIDEVGCFAHGVVQSCLLAAHILIFILGVALYWLGGIPAIIAVYVGIPVALLVSFSLLSWLFVPSPEQRRAYLREKRRTSRRKDEVDEVEPKRK